MRNERHGRTRAWETGAALVVAALTLGAAACKGGEKQAGETAAAPAQESTAAAAPAASTGGAAPAPGNPPQGATPQMVALGDSIFHGQAAGGTCFTCHGADAKGTPLAPPLVQHKWLTGDGSYQFIQTRVSQGMPNPTPPYASPMPPMGGAQLDPSQVKAVAAYVYSISR